MQNQNQNQNNQNNQNQEEDNPLIIYSLPPRGGFDWLPVNRSVIADHAKLNRELDDQDMHNDFLKKKFRESTGENCPDDVDEIYEKDFYVDFSEGIAAKKTRRNRKKIFNNLYKLIIDRRRERRLRRRNRNNNNNN